MADFIHLHNHTDFSLLDASQKIETMCNRVYDLKMDSIAVTDHGNLFSMIPFYKQAKEKGIKPILGCEIYVSVNKHTEKKQITTAQGKKWGYHHLVLIVKNEIGYKNLMKLVSIGYLDGFYYRPRIDKDLLRKYHEGLICTSGCLAGEVNQYAAAGDYENAKIAALEYKEIFNDRYYLELQNHGIPEEEISRKTLIKLSKELNIPLVATNDCHYTLEDHWEAHDVLFCLGTGKERADLNRPKYEPRQFYIRSADEMYELFKDVPEALENTLKIAEQCDVNIKMGEYHLPSFPIPQESQSTDVDSYLQQICYDGLKLRYPDITSEIKTRLDYELNVIKKMGFAGYFLITHDFVKYAKTNDIPVGPGRGSAAGSIVAFCTGITDVDPIKYKLLFERFLNPERVTMPDIDIDFCIEGREKVIDYIKAKYGNDSVAQIITFGTMKAKSVVRDVGRVLGMPYSDVDRIAKMIPNEPKMTLEKAMEVNADFSNIPNQDDTHNQLINYSSILEGVHRHASTHAAGVVITPGPLTDYVPLFKNPGTKDITTQVDMIGLEDLGLLKMDFLGLRNLTVINKAVKMIEKKYKKNIDINKLNLSEPKVFELFSKGKTDGIFQFESAGMKEYLKQLKPTSIHEIITMNALYRPGPMANIPKYINRKKGTESISYIHESLKPILNDTRGIIVYQEQVMEIGSKIGGFTLAQADEMRRAMGKKKKNLMATFKTDFVKGAALNGIETKNAIEIFDLLAKFAQYGFNKSHSTAYALIAYQTAWLKIFYPAEFMSANMSSEINDTDRLSVLVDAAKNMGLKVMAPNVNEARADFYPKDSKTVLYGLAAIKNVGYKVAKMISEHRSDNGPFKNIFDICKVDPSSINRKVLESLICSGACMDFEMHKAQMYENIDNIIKIAQKEHAEEASSQSNLFGTKATDAENSFYNLPEIEKWNDDFEINKEREYIGFYFSGNPLGKYINDLKEFENIDPSNLPEKIPSSIKIGGLISDIKVRYDKNNKPWAILSIEGHKAKFEGFIFSSTYEKNKELLIKDSKLFFIAKPSNKNDDENSLKVVIEKVIKIDEIKDAFVNYINLRLLYDNSDSDVIDKIKNCFEEEGKYKIIFHMINNLGLVQKIRSTNIFSNCTHSELSKLREILGQKNVWIT